jgi:hypothetical protein
MEGEPLVTRAARMVAAHTALRRMPPYAPGYGAPLGRFLDEWVTEVQPQGGLRITLEPDRPGGAPLLAMHASMVKGDYGDDYARLTDYMLRPPPTGGRIEVYLEHVKGEPRTGIHDGVDPEGQPWTDSSLRAAVLAGNRGWLTQQTDVWRNPYIIGRLRSLVWSGNRRLWQHCKGDYAEAARVAWETLRGTCPWAWHFDLQHHEPHWVGKGESLQSNPASTLSPGRKRLLQRVATKASTLYASYHALPSEVPLHVLAVRKGAPRKRRTGTLEALAFWLVEHRDGPGIPPTRAAALLGCKDHTSIRHAVDAYVEKNPKAPRWPDKHRDWNRRIPLGDDGTMAHHA